MNDKKKKDEKKVETYSYEVDLGWVILVRTCDANGNIIETNKIFKKDKEKSTYPEDEE
jgi:hypothetical protein